MRQYIILIVTFVLVLVMYYIQISYLKETKEYLLADLYEIEFYVKENDYKQALNSAKSLENSFYSYEDSWDAYSDHSHVEEIKEYICTIIKYIEEEERTEVLVNTSCLSNKLKHVTNTEKLTIANIF